MKYIKQTAVILGITFIGEILHGLLPFPIPAGIYGILILFICLMTGVIRTEQIRETGDFLISIMPMLFIPSIAGIINVREQISGRWPRYLAVIVISTVTVMVITGRVTQALLKKDDPDNE